MKTPYIARLKSQVSSLKIQVIGFGRATCDVGRETVCSEQIRNEIEYSAIVKFDDRKDSSERTGKA